MKKITQTQHTLRQTSQVHYHKTFRKFIIMTNDIGYTEKVYYSRQIYIQHGRQLSPLFRLLKDAQVDVKNKNDINLKIIFTILLEQNNTQCCNSIINMHISNIVASLIYTKTGTKFIGTTQPNATAQYTVVMSTKSVPSKKSTLVDFSINSAGSLLTQTTNAKQPLRLQHGASTVDQHEHALQPTID